MKLKGKTVLISGATRGIGKEVKNLLLEKGCEVFGFGRKEYDLTNEVDIYKLAHKVVRHIDILINNAGVFSTDPIRNHTIGEWDYCFAVNVRGPFILTRELLRYSRLTEGSVILNIHSWDTISCPESQIAYNCSKAALQTLTSSLHHELSKEGIYVTGITLPIVKTDMLNTINPMNPIEGKIYSAKEAAKIIWRKLREI